MLFAGWEVRIVQNCDQGLENGLENAAFSRPQSQFFTIRSDPKPANNIYIFTPENNMLSSHVKNPPLLW